MPLHADLAAPSENRVAGELGAIITDDHPRLAALGDQLRQFAHDTATRDRGVRHRRQALPGHIIDHVKNPKPPAGSQLVVHEVQAPALVR